MIFGLSAMMNFEQELKNENKDPCKLVKVQDVKFITELFDQEMSFPFTSIT